MYPDELREQIERDMKLVMTIKNAMVDATDYFNQLKRLGEEDYFGSDFDKQVRMTTYALNMTIQIIGETVIKFSNDYNDNYLDGIDALRIYKA